MTVLTKLEHANGDRPIKELGAQGFFDDLPESVRAGFWIRFSNHCPSSATSWAVTARARTSSPPRPPMAISLSRSLLPSRIFSSPTIWSARRAPPPAPDPAKQEQFPSMTTSRSNDDAREQTATDTRVLKGRELDQEG